jgi:hypothetical protein
MGKKVSKVFIGTKDYHLYKLTKNPEIEGTADPQYWQAWSSSSRS